MFTTTKRKRDHNMFSWFRVDLHHVSYKNKQSLKIPLIPFKVRQCPSVSASQLTNLPKKEKAIFTLEIPQVPPKFCPAKFCTQQKWLTASRGRVGKLFTLRAFMYNQRKCTMQITKFVSFFSLQGNQGRNGAASNWSYS